MKHLHRTSAAIAAVATAIILVAGCGGSGSHATGPSDGPSSSGPVTSSPSTGPSTGSTKGPTGAGNGSTPTATASIPTGSGGAAGAPQTGAGDAAAYWAVDGRHYFQKNGVWYFDFWSRPEANTADNPDASKTYDVYNALTNQMVYQYTTYWPGFIGYHDLTNPMFKYVEWAVWPVGTAATAANTQYELYDHNFQTHLWFTSAQLTNMIDNGTGTSYGIPVDDPLAHTGTIADQVVAANGGILASTWGQPNCANGCTPLG